MSSTFLLCNNVAESDHSHTHHYLVFKIIFTYKHGIEDLGGL
jgi:hypothetical protein